MFLIEKKQVLLLTFYKRHSLSFQPYLISLYIFSSEHMRVFRKCFAKFREVYDKRGGENEDIPFLLNYIYVTFIFPNFLMWYFV